MEYISSFIQTPGNFLGNGGAIVAGILLGKREKKKAGEVLSATLFLTVVFGLLCFVSVFFLWGL